MLIGVLSVLALIVAAPFYALGGIVMGADWIVKKVLARRTARRAGIEAELDRRQAELRGTILNLADALGMEAHEARKALIRESFRARGDVPRD